MRSGVNSRADLRLLHRAIDRVLVLGGPTFRLFRATNAEPNADIAAVRVDRRGFSPPGLPGSERECRSSSSRRHCGRVAPGSSGCRNRPPGDGSRTSDGANGAWRAWRSRPLVQHDVVAEDSQLDTEDLLIQKQQGAAGLVLGGGGDVPGDGQIGEEAVDLGGPHLLGVPLAVKQDEATHPADVSLLGPQAVMQGPGRHPHPVEQPGPDGTSVVSIRSRPGIGSSLISRLFTESSVMSCHHDRVAPRCHESTGVSCAKGARNPAMCRDPGRAARGCA